MLPLQSIIAIHVRNERNVLTINVQINWRALIRLLRDLTAVVLATAALINAMLQLFALLGWI